VEFASGLSRSARAYTWTVVFLGFVIISESLLHLYQTPIGPQWLLLAFLTLVSGSASVYLPWANISISISEAFTFTAVLLYGPEAGTLTVALDGLVISYWVARRRPEVDRALFNIAAPALSAWCSAQLFFLLSGISPLADVPANQPTSLDRILPSLVVFAVVYFALNSWLIAFVIALKKRLSPWTVWRTGFIWLSLNYFCGASVAILLVGYNRVIDLRFVGVVVPLLLVLYFTFKTSTERVTDANRHVDQLNTLYLSTIETLAMAIDAKDQITHGHIRRVQSYAVGLAKSIGISDAQLIKAIEAAALLHDMGKLAVPEYILNKPGKLTPVEFEKMKLHASVGADILSAINFPYPVVPIVRHHHENWNGKGYPDGLRGTDIPIGARILSVVDCFDALTSDRPYRPRLTDDEAISILVERRGVMYDPLVVDTFIRVHAELSIQPTAIGLPRSVLSGITTTSQVATPAVTESRLDEIAASADEMLTLYELAQGLAGQANITDTADIITKHLRRLVPFSLCVFFAHDISTDELVARHVAGDVGADVRGTRIQLGQRLSGWVASNRQTIINSDPALDFGDVARTSSPRLRSCLSTPLVVGADLVGVLSLYSNSVDGFTDDHRRVIEMVAKHIAHTFHEAAEFDTTTKRDPLTGLPSLSQLEQLLSNTAVKRSNADPDSSLILVEVVGLPDIVETHGRAAGDETIRQVVKQIRSSLRMTDILFRCGSADFAALLNDTDMAGAKLLASRIAENIRSHHIVGRNAEPMIINVIVTATRPPLDGSSLGQLRTSIANRSSSRAEQGSASSIH
jgi:diguanylate cyclase (GGDEF)-like protein/putative nucleotidyltransferase with HDIG domain